MLLTNFEWILGNSDNQSYNSVWETCHEFQRLYLASQNEPKGNILLNLYYPIKLSLTMEMLSSAVHMVPASLVWLLGTWNMASAIEEWILEFISL